jgi:hypothetical protein
VLVALFVFALVKTFWPSRSVALPSAPPAAIPVGDVTARLARLQESIERLGSRVEALERSSVEAEPAGQPRPTVDA